MKVLFAAAAFAALTGAAQATTVTETFDFVLSPSGGWTWSINQTQGDLTVSVTGTRANPDKSLNDDPAAVSSSLLTGLGVTQMKTCGNGYCSDDESSLIDSKTDSDVALFDFFLNGVRTAVRIIDIGFSYVDPRDVANLYVGGTFSGSTSIDDGVFPNSYSRVDVSGRGIVTDQLGVGASAYSYVGRTYCDTIFRSAFKITSLTVSYDAPDTPAVPLPAGGLLLLPALGGLALLKRRRKA